MMKKHGFTLVELMIVMAVIAILATIAFFGLNKAQAAARDVQRQQIMNGFRGALERYYADNQTYPANLSSVVPAYMAAPTDPGCGSGAVAFSGVSPWAPCGSVNYAYVGGSSYTLTLTKEGGGISYFRSPQ